VGDDSVPVLSTFGRLRVLDVKGTAITEQGVAELRKNLPGCRVLY
jgi:hypothetical protein